MLSNSINIVVLKASASGEGSCRVRDKTRGMKVFKLRRQLGHAIPILIPASSLAPEGEFATAFPNLLGEAIRDEAPVRKEGWKIVPEGIKKLVIKRVQVISFEINLLFMQIQLNSLMFNCCLTLHVYVCNCSKFLSSGTM